MVAEPDHWRVVVPARLAPSRRGRPRAAPVTETRGARRLAVSRSRGGRWRGERSGGCGAPPSRRLQGWEARS